MFVGRGREGVKEAVAVGDGGLEYCAVDLGTGCGRGLGGGVEVHEHVLAAGAVAKEDDLSGRCGERGRVKVIHA